MRPVLRKLLFVLNALVLVATLYWVDALFSVSGNAGSQRNAARGGLRRIANSSADAVVLLGSSTARDWVPPSQLAAMFAVEPDDVLDAHINGCHQGCTWAEVRHLLAQSRRFQVAVYGLNLFQMCEHPHTKRALQHRELLPPGELPALVRLYAHSQHGLARIGHYFGGWISGVYGDTTATQLEGARRYLGRWDPDRSWVRPDEAPASGPPRCAYRARDVAYKRALSEALFDDLGRLAERTFVVLLPDESLASDDPVDIEAWKRHRALLGELADAREHVTLIDLATPRPKSDFSDGLHLTSEAGIEQLRSFHDALSAGGHLP